MAQVIAFNLKKEEYVSIAEKALSDGDAEKSVSFINRALDVDPDYVKARLMLARVYSGLGAQALSNAVLFKTLGAHPGGDSEDRIFYNLAMNYLDLGQSDVAAYYLRDFGDDYDIEYIEEERNADDGFHVVYPRGEDYYEMLIERAYSLVREKRFDEAIEILKDVDPRSKSADAANHVVLVCYMMKNDLDRVIDSAKEMLRANPDSLAVKCTLATAYMMEEKQSDAYAVMDDILTKDYTRLEDILLLLPILVNLEMHPQVVKYTNRVLENLKLQPNTMIWLSQGLYNIGQRKEARRVMNRVKNIYGEYTSADYFLKLYDTNPPQIEYSMTLPYAERLNRYKTAENYLRMQTHDFARALANDPELKKLIKWVFEDGNEKLEFMFIARLDSVKNAWVDSFYRELLIKPDLSFELMSRLLSSLLDNGFILETAVVAQDRYKKIFICLPEAYYKLPHIFKDAVGYSVCDIIFTDEEPDFYLERLRWVVDSIARLDENGKLKFKRPQIEKVSRLRSMRTLVGVLLSKVYDDDENPRLSSINRYGLNERTFDKYSDIVFGSGDETKEFDEEYAKYKEDEVKNFTDGFDDFPDGFDPDFDPDFDGGDDDDDDDE